MKKWILFPLIIILFSCKRETVTTYFTTEKAAKYFESIEATCYKDSGKLWGENLFGPIMFVDRSSRNIIANYPDLEGLLKEKDGVYIGVFPKELIINNGALMYGGTLYAMTSLPFREDEYRIKTRAIRGLFHCFQKRKGIISNGYNTNNMDEKEARLWIKLEWKALRKAINSEGEERQVAIRDALIFRGSNRELYQKYAIDENRFETYEGLATFTYTMLCTNSREEYKNRLFENLDRIYAMQSYSRSYGFIHGALYSTLLFDKAFDFNQIESDNFDLGSALKELYNIELPAICRDVAGSLAVSYDIENIIKEEDIRLAEIKERIDKQIGIFTENPVVFLELESPYFDFEPEDIHSFDTLGTLYDAMRVSDNWGKLSVDKVGCLVSNNFKYLRITAKGFKQEKNHISGEGWILNLNNDWVLVEVNKNYFVRKLMP